MSQLHNFSVNLAYTSPLLNQLSGCITVSDEGVHPVVFFSFCVLVLVIFCGVQPSKLNFHLIIKYIFLLVVKILENPELLQAATTSIDLEVVISSIFLCKLHVHISALDGAKRAF